MPGNDYQNKTIRRWGTGENKEFLQGKKGKGKKRKGEAGKNNQFWGKKRRQDLLLLPGLYLYGLEQEGLGSSNLLVRSGSRERLRVRGGQIIDRVNEPWVHQGGDYNTGGGATHRKERGKGKRKIW